MAEVIVCVPSFRRPLGLAQLLGALAVLETSADIRVLVADNDSERHEALDVCAKLVAEGYRWPLECIVVAERGIAQARNALVAGALKTDAKFVAMLDDDEWPSPQWLDAFLRVQAATCADALHGGVIRVFEAEPDVAASRCNGLGNWHNSTGLIDSIESTSNVLLSRAFLESMPRPWFDPAFALTGGEDRDFFTRMKRMGAKFGWADEAWIYAHVPASRATLAWALKRAYRVGNSDMRVFLKHRADRQARIGEIVKIAGTFAVSPFYIAVTLPIARKRGRALQIAFRAAGKTAALFGQHYDEYAVTHGH